MLDLPLILLIVLGLLVWLLLAVGIVMVVVALPSWRRSAPDRAGPPSTERRRGDRRIGLPDTRDLPIERRSGFDRRSGPAAMA